MPLVPIPNHYMLHALEQQLKQAMPVLEVEVEGHRQPKVEYFFYNHLSDSPGLKMRMYGDPCIYTASVSVVLRNRTGYGLSGTTEDAVVLELTRQPRIEAFENQRRFKSMGMRYERSIRNSKGELTVMVDEFVAQIVASLKFFFDNHYPAAMPEFSPWLESVEVREIEA